MPETDFAPLDDGENDGVNPSTEPAIGEIIVRRLSRRELLRGVAAVAAAAPSGRMLLEAAPAAAQAHGPGSTTFREIAHGMDERDHLPPGYAAKVLLRWGDPLAPDAPRFDAVRQSAAAQERQFGYNCDYVGFLPLPAGSRSSDHGLLFVNHEYTIPNLMFPGLDAGRGSALEVSREQTEIERTALRSSRSVASAAPGASCTALATGGSPPPRRWACPDRRRAIPGCARPPTRPAAPSSAC